MSAIPEPPKASLDLARLKDGDAVGDYFVVAKLGEGGFGAVYKVRDAKGACMAMKTEKATEIVRVLKMEVLVLREAKAKKPGSCSHFCDIHDSGRLADFNYLVMSLVGPSLHDLRKNVVASNQTFTLGCAVSVGIQCISAIQELHEIGFLHRDIKPGNFAIGLENPRQLFIFDFGMCRRFKDPMGNVRNPRWQAGFRGTVRYAPLSCHIARETCRKDDLEAWLYMQIEYTRGSLPWRHIDKHDDVCKYKEKCRRGEARKELFGGCPKEYINLLNYCDALYYYDEPNYEKMRELMRATISNNRLQEFPYDWEKKMDKPSKT